jgi:hypothetical protein
LFAYGIFKVLYAPFKAFREIIENPQYIGPILIMILFVLGNVGSIYIVVSRTYVEQTLPETSKLDEWTENKTLWTPVASENFIDYVNGSCLGNRSLEFQILDSTFMQMQLDNPQPVNCSGIEGYKNMSFRLKLIASEPNSSIISLHSSSTDYFYYDFEVNLTSLETGRWDNFTIQIGPESRGWSNNGTQPDWSSITNVRFVFRWPEPVNATVRIDGLFFRGVFISELRNVSNHILSFSVSSVMQFTIRWFILSGIIFLASKALGSQTAWKPVLIVVGFTFIVLIIQSLINIGVYANLSILHYPLEYFCGIKGEFEPSQDRIFEQTLFI